jgi:hypothetical protein
MNTIQRIQTLIGTTPDGIWGNFSRAALSAIPDGDRRIVQVQAILGVKQDGQWGPVSQAALDALATPAQNATVHHGTASSFADPADIAAFRRCKAEGMSDEEAFRHGDNGIGKWGDDCTEGSGPSCALPPEDWEQFGAAAHLKPVIVTGNGRTVTALLKDTMPHLANRENDAIIDCNPDLVRALGMEPPMMLTGATWQWG